MKFEIKEGSVVTKKQGRFIRVYLNNILMYSENISSGKIYGAIRFRKYAFRYVSKMR